MNSCLDTKKIYNLLMNITEHSRFSKYKMHHKMDNIDLQRQDIVTSCSLSNTCGGLGVCSLYFNLD